MAATPRGPHENPLARDLDEILEATDGWADLRGERIFVTGGSGFVGAWLLESLVWANERLKLNTRVVVLTRDPERMRAKLPHIVAAEGVELLRGDVQDFALPDGSFSHILHAATPVSTESIERYPRGLFDTIVRGTEHVIDLAERCGGRRLLLTSSGAVYGPLPIDVDRVDETFRGGPDCTDPRAVYAEGKRASELLGVLASKHTGLEVALARGFSFVGPYLPIDAHYAIGNFIRDALAGGPIRVQGDGTPFRSYLYAGDLATWLWTILFRGASGRPYNVGSDAPLSILELAHVVSKTTRPPLPVVVERVPMPGHPLQRYVPSTDRAASELGLRARVGLQEAIARTMRWNSSRQGESTRGRS